MIIGHSLSPLNSSRTWRGVRRREMVRRSDDNSRRKVQNVRGDSSVTFIDDSRHRRCASGVLVFTGPGSRVVRVCADELKRINAQQHGYVVATLIHEIPPTSREITARVLARCGRK